jgi:hypothetical protein
MAVEEHGAGKQLLRFRVWPRCSRAGVVVIVLFSALSGGAALDHAWIACAILGMVAAALAVRMLRECAAAAGAFVGGVRGYADLVEVSDAADRPRGRKA